MVVTANGVPAASVRFPASRRILTNPNQSKDYDVHDVSDQFAVNFSDTVFGFLEQDHGLSLESNSSSGSEGYRDEAEDEEENGASAEERKAFWDEQHQLLKETLCKISPLELKIRNATKEAMREVQAEGNFCACRSPVITEGGACRNCLMRDVSGRLRTAGYNSAVCKSKWRSSPDIPSGEHTFVDVLDNSKKKEVRIIIELNFRPEFEISRASEEYKKLISRLPDAFVGRADRVRTLIRILCIAAKKCMKDNKMHMGPWRRQKYMQAKWSHRNCERMAGFEPAVPKFSDSDWGSAATKNGQGKKALPKRGSLLTVALLGGNVMSNDNLCSNAVTVV